ncbi:hypothetical protein ACFYST_06135 [Kitasatospora sp. NPDC004614]|uniref:hypothetical protein n=1 Tax=unclassified Kitasatospora TaxID=2633591 RepID=UPI0036B49A90
MATERTTPSEQNWHGSPETMRDVAANIIHDAVSDGYDGSAKGVITTANNLNTQAARREQAQNN